jgi:hypothetical protein
MFGHRRVLYNWCGSSCRHGTCNTVTVTIARLTTAITWPQTTASGSNQQIIPRAKIRSTRTLKNSLSTHPSNISISRYVTLPLNMSLCLPPVINDISSVTLASDDQKVRALKSDLVISVLYPYINMLHSL